MLARRFSRFVVVAAVAVIVAACGNNSSKVASTTGTATPTPTPTPTPVSSSVTCTPGNYADGATVYYTGKTGSGQFSDATQSYVGVIQNLYFNGSVEEATVNWESLNGSLSFTGLEPLSEMVPTATCSPTIIGTSVLYIGTQGASNANFSNVNAIYTGTILAVFAGGYAEVQWASGGPAYPTVESFTNLALGQ